MRISLHTGSLEDTGLGAVEDRGEFDEFHTKTGVGLVGTETFLGLEPRHARKRGGPITSDRFGCVRDCVTDRRKDVFLVDEAHLGIELHELELAIGT